MIIEIDCPPGSPRPDTYMIHICKEILNIELPETIGRCFGCWTWDVPDYDEIKKSMIKDYLTDCYNHGWIRYASW